MEIEGSKRRNWTWFDSLLNYNYFHTGTGAPTRWRCRDEKVKTFCAVSAVSFGQFSSQRNFTLPRQCLVLVKVGYVFTTTNLIIFYPQLELIDELFFVVPRSLSMNSSPVSTECRMTLLCVYTSGKFLVIVVVAVECSLTRVESKP